MTSLQAQYNRKYLDSNPEAKEKHRINGYKSKGKKFILEFATREDLELFKSYIASREKELDKQEGK